MADRIAAIPLPLNSSPSAARLREVRVTVATGRRALHLDEPASSAAGRCGMMRRTVSLPPAPARHGRFHPGVLIATLLSLDAGAGPMRALGQTEVRGTAHRPGRRMRRRQFLAQLQPGVGARLRVPIGRPAGEYPFFSGDTSSVAWVGAMHVSAAVAASTAWRWSRWTARSLVLRPPWDGSPGFSAWQAASTQVIAHSVRAMRLSYRHPLTGEWLDAWPPPASMLAALQVKLPDAVRIDYDVDGPPWPPMVLLLTPTFMSDPSANIAVFGG